MDILGWWDSLRAINDRVPRYQAAVDQKQETQHTTPQ
jgi:hypothetical protein